MTDSIDFEQLYRDVLPTVVSLYPTTTAHAPQSTGSGFVYDDGHILTNHHVIATTDPTDDVDVRFADGTWRHGRVTGSDPYTDLAVLHVPDLPPNAPALPIAPDTPTPGRPVAALGNPLGLDGSISAGIVSGINRSLPTEQGFAIPDVVQTDAPINPGNSGGPLVGLAQTQSLGYEAVGVNRAKAGDNIGFAISPAIINRVVPALVTDGAYDHPYLRIRTIDVTPTIADANDLDEPRGLLVVDTHPSNRHLLRPSRRRRRLNGREIPVGGDNLLRIDGRDLNSHEDLMRYLITERDPGEDVELDLLRDGDPKTVRVPLSARPPSGGQRSTDIPIR